ncbi:hypothetical protein BC829DRAFT_64045 [Chytridium lagenaria]|nr:hypothetical protein BC829DRAFT_64045 [Chytridium lagenaria]
MSYFFVCKRVPLVFSVFDGCFSVFFCFYFDIPLSESDLCFLFCFFLYDKFVCFLFFRLVHRFFQRGVF